MFVLRPDEPERLPIGEIRRLAIIRSRGRCEVPICGEPLWRAGCELNHILSGPDRKRLESLETVIVMCVRCHQEKWHQNDEDTLAAVRSWAEANRFTLAAQACERRLAKLATSPLRRRPA